MTNMTKFEWNLLAQMAYSYEEYLEENTKVASRGQEELLGIITEVDYSVDSSDLCYLVDWGNNREEWVSREEIYLIADDDTKELINPNTKKPYTFDRITVDEVGWYRYGKQLNSKAHYEKKYYSAGDKLLYKHEKEEARNRLEHQINCLRLAVTKFEKDSDNYNKVVAKGKQLVANLKSNNY